ncbi:MAG: lipid-binding SYLF domain-containing protein [Magnetospirillum sp.]|nr:lipid-binding SYLF domain-containing protein [Magnetospirillum sp.]
MIRRLLPLLILAAGLLGAAPAGAQAVTDQTLLVARAVNTVERLRSDSRMQSTITDRLAHARAVLIVPNLVKGGFLFGAEYGTGVLLTRSPDGGWSGPAFYSVASGSFGLQIGLQDAETLYVIMSDGGLSAIMNNRMKLGADAGIAMVIVGAGAEASTTTNAGADIYAFNNAVGAYGGVSLEGSAILPRHAWNAAYYGGNPTPEDILLARKVDNPQADRLRDVLAR